MTDIACMNSRRHVPKLLDMKRTTVHSTTRLSSKGEVIDMLQLGAGRQSFCRQRTAGLSVTRFDARASGVEHYCIVGRCWRMIPDPVVCPPCLCLVSSRLSLLPMRWRQKVHVRRAGQTDMDL